jgi:hypothetical protein
LENSLFMCDALVPEIPGWSLELAGKLPELTVSAPKLLKER